MCGGSATAVTPSICKCPFSWFKQKPVWRKTKDSGLKKSLQRDWSEIGGESVIHCYKYRILFLNKNNFSVTPACPNEGGSSRLIGSWPMAVLTETDQSAALQSCSTGGEKTQEVRGLFFPPESGLFNYL